MTTKLTIGDWIYIFGFGFLIVFMIYLSRKEQQIASNNASPSDTPKS